MELNTRDSSGMMNGLPPTKREDRNVGPIVGALVVVLLIIVVTLYFFGKRLNTQNSQPVTDQVATQQNTAQVEATITPAEIESMQDELDDQVRNVDFSF